MKQLFALIALSLFCSCVTAQPAAVFGVEKKRATECLEHCASLEMKLSAVVVIANQCGCVCEPVSSAAVSEKNGAAAVTGGMAITVA